MNKIVNANGKQYTYQEFYAAKNLHVSHGLDFEDNTIITHLPEGLHVGGSLNLRGTSITALPEGLHVESYLDLRGTSITALPEGLHVEGYLDLEGASITALPEVLHVGGSLYLYGTSITAHRTSTTCFLNLPKWPVKIQTDFIKIGCQKHCASEWFNFDDSQIQQMHDEALEWWRKHKQTIHDEWQKLKNQGE